MPSKRCSSPTTQLALRKSLGPCRSPRIATSKTIRTSHLRSQHQPRCNLHRPQARRLPTFPNTASFCWYWRRWEKIFGEKTFFYETSENYFRLNFQSNLFGLKILRREIEAHDRSRSHSRSRVLARDGATAERTSLSRVE